MNLPKFESERVFFTSDSHYCHEAIIRYCDRSFESTEEMNEVLIKNWNSVVSPEDTVFHLGDFGLGPSEKLKEIFQRLNGEIYLIMGNHDFRQTKRVLSMFKEVHLEMLIEVERTKIILNHYPMLCYSGSNRTDVWQLFGHVHTREKTRGFDTGRLQHLFPTQYDVGVDNNNFIPVSFENLKQIIQLQIEKNSYERLGRYD